MFIDDMKNDGCVREKYRFNMNNVDISLFYCKYINNKDITINVTYLDNMLPMAHKVSTTFHGCLQDLSWATLSRYCHTTPGRVMYASMLRYRLFW